MKEENKDLVKDIVCSSLELLSWVTNEEQDYGVA
jgi:hypothetical protein